jgi:glutaminyl-tRNA synthetase
VTGWDDPRLPTLSGLRRRGVTARALRDFSTGIGVTKYNALTDVAVLDKAVRDDLNRTALRRFAVLDPVRIVLTNIPEGETIPCTAINNPEDPASGTRVVALTREVWIEQDDFMEVPPPKYFRLRPGGEVRLKYACIIQCQEVVKDASGKVVEIRCVADLSTRTGEANSGKKVKGTIHWVSASEGIEAEVRLYDRLFTEPEPGKDGRDFLTVLNPDSLRCIRARLEPSLGTAVVGQQFQFERLGYFYPDPDSQPGQPVFNRTIALKDAWAKANS